MLETHHSRIPRREIIDPQQVGNRSTARLWGRQEGYIWYTASKILLFLFTLKKVNLNDQQPCSPALPMITG